MFLKRFWKSSLFPCSFLPFFLLPFLPSLPFSSFFFLFPSICRSSFLFRPSVRRFFLSFFLFFLIFCNVCDLLSSFLPSTTLLHLSTCQSQPFSVPRSTAGETFRRNGRRLCSRLDPKVGHYSGICDGDKSWWVERDSAKSSHIKKRHKRTRVFRLL